MTIVVKNDQNRVDRMKNQAEEELDGSDTILRLRIELMKKRKFVREMENIFSDC